MYKPLLALPLFLFPSWFLSLIIADVSISSLEAHYVRLASLVLPFLPLGSSAIIYFQAIGNSEKATTLPLLRQVVLFLPIFLLMPHFWGVTGIYYALLIENIIYGLALLLLLGPALRGLLKKEPELAA